MQSSVSYSVEDLSLMDTGDFFFFLVQYLPIENNFKPTDFSAHFHCLLSIEHHYHQCSCLFTIVPVTVIPLLTT